MKEEPLGLPGSNILLAFERRLVDLAAVRGEGVLTDTRVDTRDLAGIVEGDRGQDDAAVEVGKRVAAELRIWPIGSERQLWRFADVRVSLRSVRRAARTVARWHFRLVVGDHEVIAVATASGLLIGHRQRQRVGQVQLPTSRIQGQTRRDRHLACGGLGDFEPGHDTRREEPLVEQPAH